MKIKNSTIYEILYEILFVISILFTIYNFLIGYFSLFLYFIILTIIIISFILNKKEQSKIAICLLLVIYILSIISYITGFLSTSDKLFKIIPKSKYGYSFERGSVDIDQKQKYKIIDNYNDFIDIYNQIKASFKSYYDYAIKTRTTTNLFIFEKNYYFLSNKREDKFLENELNKIKILNNEINTEYFNTKNVLVINEKLGGIRALNSEISKVSENDNTVNIIIDLNNPEKVSFISSENNVHIIYINKNITNANIKEINK